MPCFLMKSNICSMAFHAAQVNFFLISFFESFASFNLYTVAAHAYIIPWPT